jgi:hypothetical protein
MARERRQAAVPSTGRPVDLAARYLELTRLRLLVRKAEHPFVTDQSAAKVIAPVPKYPQDVDAPAHDKCR